MTMDVHEGVSPPSPIYELEMIENDGIVYPLINILDLNVPASLGASSKPAKKYVHIIPALEQALLNEKDSLPPGSYNNSGPQHVTALDATPVLGFKDQAVFNDKKFTFKIRLTSKKTGKRIDLNLGFDNQHIETEQEKNPSEYANTNFKD